MAGSVNVLQPGVYVLTYTAKDSSGNQAVPVNRTVTVVDTTAPIITLIGDALISIKQGDAFNDPGSVVTDAETGLQAVVSGVVDINTVAVYTLTYDVTDSSGNVATSVIRTVEVKDPIDLTAPVFTLNGSSFMTLEVGENFTDPGASATDAVDGNRNVSISGTVDTSKLGIYTLTYTATDLSGNSVKATRTRSSR